MSVCTNGGLSINPNIEYNLRSEGLSIKAASPGSKYGNVYVLPRSQRINEVIDFSKIPFKRGQIFCVEETQEKIITAFDYLTKHVEIDDKVYKIRSSNNFEKGAYCGRQYELARKISYVNQYGLPNERELCPDCEITHDGTAVSTNSKHLNLMDLDINEIERSYSATRSRVEPLAYYSEKLMPVAVVAGLVAISVITSLFVNE